MLTHLLESRPAHARRSGGTVASVATHALLIALAVVGTQRIADADDTPGERVIVIPPLPPSPPEPAPRRTASPPPEAPRDGAPETSLPREPELPPIGEIAIEIPPPGPPLVHADSFVDGLRGARDGAGPRGPEGGDAFLGTEATVERAVVPLAGNAPPRYPEALRAAGVEGRVVVRFVVDTLGRVEAGSLAIVDATHDAFAAAVRDAVVRLRFTPAEAYGRRARQQVEQPFEFRLGRR